jgi:hypothetical protein
MVRFIYFMVMKFLVQKEQLCRSWDQMARAYLLNGALGLSGMMMCGSYGTAVNAKICAIPGGPRGRLHELEDETHKLFGVAYNEIMYMTLDSMGIRRNSDHDVVTCACLSEDASVPQRHSIQLRELRHGGRR